jgi:hypothetical protein
MNVMRRPASGPDARKKSMPTFSIDADNNITIFASLEGQGNGADTETFSTAQELRITPAMASGITDHVWELSDEPEPLSTRHSRVIFCVGGDRFAIDFTSTITELKPRPAEVIPIGRKRSAKRRRVSPDRHDRTSSLRRPAVNKE